MPVVAEYMTVHDDNTLVPHVALYRMSPLAVVWRHVIFWLDPCCRKPWRLWYWTGLCGLWQREASRKEYALVPVTPGFADKYFDWDWRGTDDV